MNTTNTVSSNPNSNSSVSDVADRLSNAADQTIDKTRKAVNDKLDQTESAIHSVRERAEPVINRLGDQAAALKQRGADALRQGQEYVRKSGELTAQYVQEQPLKSVLLAVGAGALLAVLAGAVLRRSSDR